MKHAVDIEKLKTLPLFHGLSTGQLTWIRSQVHRSTFRSQTRVLTAGQPAVVLYIILEGAVKVQTEQPDGAEFLLNILTDGDLIGEISLLYGTHQLADVITLQKCATLWMERNILQECLNTMPTCSANLLRILSDRLHRTNERMQAIATFDVRGRVAYQILSLAERCGQTISKRDTLIPIRLTQSDIAHMVGASRERVNQIMMDFKKQRYLSVSRHHHITIHQRAKLARQWQPGLISHTSRI
jgi:CRP-like cAMP-binding protein